MGEASAAEDPRDVWGVEIASRVQYWVDRATDLVVNRERAEPFVRKNLAYRRDRAFREGLATLSSDQREVVLALVRDTAMGVAFSLLVSMDQPIGGTFEIVHVARDDNEDEQAPNRTMVAPRSEDLHDELHVWIQKYARDAAFLLSDEIGPPWKRPLSWG